MRFLRNIRVGVRLGVAFGLLIVLLLVLVAVGFTNAASSQRVAEQLITDLDTTRDVDEVKFHASEFNGAQTAYVFDAALGKPGAATEANANRKTFLTAVDNFQGHMTALAADSLNSEQAAQLLGAARALQDRGGANPWTTETDRNALAMERVRAALGDVAFEKMFQAGYSMTTDEAVEIAQTLAKQGSTTGRTRPALDGVLTARELEVLELIGAGLSDKEIGEALAISPRTASKHVANILSKLGVSTRAAAADLAKRS